MRKLLLLLIVLAVLGFVGLWYLQAYRIKEGIIAFADSLDHQLKNAQIQIGEVNVSGFPFAYDIRISNIRASFKEQGDGAEVAFSHNTPIAVSGNYMGNDFTIAFPGRVDMKMKEGEKEYTTSLIFTDAPLLKLTFQPDLLHPWFLGQESQFITAVIRRLNTFSYQSGTFEYVGADHEPLSSGGKYDIFLTKELLDNQRAKVAFKMDAENLVFSPNYFQEI
ncbi:MAG: hypothetical protein KDD76_04110, partial [Rickettsiales bacterium]|nr:hypothetical protein [Rickettsiales bacterium]